MGQLAGTAVGKSVFSKGPVFSEIGRILTSIGPIPVPQMRRFQRQNFHHKRDSRSFEPPTHPGYTDADRSLGNSFSQANPVTEKLKISLFHIQAYKQVCR